MKKKFKVFYLLYFFRLFRIQGINWYFYAFLTEFFVGIHHQIQNIIINEMLIIRMQ